jgi:putative peptidyl-prolyl cis-trans isomerase
MKTLVFLYIFFIFGELKAGESLNQILAIVGNISISQIDFEKAEDKYKILSKFAPPSRKKSSYRSQVLDFLIDRAIVNIISDEESISINQKRIDLEVEKRMENMGFNNLEAFKKNILVQTGMTYEMWYDDLPYQIKKSQLLQFRVNTPPPSDTEVKNWYNKNKAKVGLEVKYREIILVPANDSIEEETKVHQELQDMRSKILKDPSAFKLIASSPRNDSKNKLNGGLVNWIPGFELFKTSRIMGSVVSQTQPGKVSEIFRDEKNRYVIVMVEGSRATPVESIKRGIQNILYKEKEEESFEQWVESQRKVVPISIYDPIYMKEHNISNKTEIYEPE